MDKYFAYSRKLKKVIECDTQDQAYEIAREDYPEYTAHCPKCDCIFGVN
jgi:hypothetical protein